MCCKCCKVVRQGGVVGDLVGGRGSVGGFVDEPGEGGIKVKQEHDML